MDIGDFLRFDYRKTSREHRTLILAAMLLWSVISYLMVRRYVLEGSEVVGHSMAPTLEQGETIVISRLPYRWRPPRRGDIVALFFPGEEGYTVKRIIALPGETVRIRDGTVWVNGKPLDEPYLPPAIFTDAGGLSHHEYQVAKGCYFVMGDNRPQSSDSRHFGAVPRDRLVGVLLLWG